MKKFEPFHPALPDPTEYFEREEKQKRYERTLQVVAGALLIATVFVGAYLYAVAVF